MTSQDPEAPRPALDMAIDFLCPPEGHFASYKQQFDAIATLHVSGSRPESYRIPDRAQATIGRTFGAHSPQHLAEYARLCTRGERRVKKDIKIINKFVTEHPDTTRRVYNEAVSHLLASERERERERTHELHCRQNDCE